MSSEESGIGYRKTHLILTFFAQILHSTSYFFIIIFPTAFYDRSRMTGKYLALSVKTAFFISAHACPFRRLTPPLSPTSGDSSRLIFFQFLLTFAPIINLSIDDLAKGKASHSLLQRRFAPRKVVRLLPDKRGQFTACILYSFMTKQTVRTDFYFFSLFSGNRKPQGFLFPWGLLILLYAFAISAVSAFLLTLTLSMTGFPSLSLEMTSIRKRSNSGSNS